MAGRPSIYSADLAARICARLAAGESLRSVCRDPAMPHNSTVADWVVENREGFAEQYARARDKGLDVMADQLLEVASTPAQGEVVTDKPTGREVKRGDAVDARRLHVDSLKWYLSKLAPKRYGDRIAVEHSGSVSIEDRLRAGRARVRGNE